MDIKNYFSNSVLPMPLSLDAEFSAIEGLLDFSEVVRSFEDMDMRLRDNMFESFQDKGKSYVLTVKVHDTAKAENINVEYNEATNQIVIDYNQEIVPGSAVISKCVETVPSDVDTNSFSAYVSKGVLTITMNKKNADEIVLDDIETVTVSKVSESPVETEVSDSTEA